METAFRKGNHFGGVLFIWWYLLIVSTANFLKQFVFLAAQKFTENTSSLKALKSVKSASATVTFIAQR